MTITIRLPNNQEVDIDTDNPQAAAVAAQQIFRRDFPDEFATWNQQRSLGGFFENFGRAARQAVGSQVEGAGIVAGEAGLPGEETLREAGRSVSGEANPAIRDFENFSDFTSEVGRRPVEALRAGAGTALGSLAGSVAAPLAVAAAAAALPVGAPTVGAIGTGAYLLSGALSGASELEGLLRNEGVDAARARTLAATLGAGIGAMEGGAAAALMSRVLGHEIKRETAEQLSRIIARGSLRNAGRGAAHGVALEGGSEFAGGAAREGVAAAETGNLNFAERLDRTLLDAAMGSFGGGVAGGAGGMRAGTRAQTEFDARFAPPPGAPAPAPQFGSERIAEPLPEEPEPITEVADAEAFLRANPQYAVPPGTTDEGIVVRANDALRSLYRDQVATVREQTLADFTGERDAIVQAGDLDADGNPTPDVVDRSRQAQTLIRNVLNAQGRGEIEEGAFTANDVANVALTRLGLGASSLTRTEKAGLQNTLVDMAKAGQLTRVGKNRFAIPEVTPNVQGRPGAAPLTADQRVAAQAIDTLQAFTTNPTQAAARTINTLAELATPNVQGMLSQFQQLVTAKRQLTRQREQVTNDAAALQNVEAQLAEVGRQQAAILETLQGMASGTLRAPESALNPQAQPEFSTQVGLSAPNIPPGMAENYAAYQAEQAAKNRPPGAEAIPIGGNEAWGSTGGWQSDTQVPVVTKTAKPQTFAEAVQTGAKTASDPRQFTMGFGVGANSPNAPTPFNFHPDFKAGQEAGRAWGRQQALAQTEDGGTTIDPHDSPAFEDPLNSDVSGFVDPDEQGSADPAFAAPYLRNPGERLEGLDVQPDGTFDYTVEIDDAEGSGVVNISGSLAMEGNQGVMRIQTARATSQVRGRGYGIKAYQNLVDWALSNNLVVHSDSQVSDAAGRVYAALQRRGYEVSRLDADQMYRAGDGWVADNLDNSIYTISPAYNFAHQGTQPLSAKTDSELTQEGTAAFRRVLGNNGRLTIQNQLFLRDLDDVVQKAAVTAGISLDTNVSGFAHKDLAALSLAAAKAGGKDFPITQAAIHEGWHVAENLGMFSANEIRLINANLDKIKAVVAKYIPSADIENQPNHEIRAYGLNARAAQKADFGSTINKIFDRFVNFLNRIRNFMQGRGFQTWQDVYDAFDSGGMADRQGQLQERIAASPDVNFAAPRLPANTRKAHEIVKRAQADLIGGGIKGNIFKYFASPVLTMGKVNAELRPAADVQKTLYTRGQEMVVDTESLIANAHKLPPASVAKITRVWEAASRSKKKPNMSGLNAQEKAALEGEMASVQHALNYFIEASVIGNYMPTSDKTPAVRARLEKFWAKHEGKHLWEIPQRDLMAASPEGYREMQKYERIRNPYYMPMMARGTHFVAAYKVGPGGKRGELVGMVPYTPNNFAQRMRGFGDPVAAARAQLAAEFSGPKYTIMTEGQQFSNDKQAADLRDQGDFIAQYLQKLSDVTRGSKDAQNLIAQMTSQIDKAQIERIFRPNRDILRAITPGNEASYILDTIPQYLLSMSKVQARRYTQDAYTEATKSLSVNDKAFLDDLRNYSTTPSEAFGTLRSLAFFQYLGGAIDTALVNMTQGFQTNAMLARDGGLKGSAAFGSALKDVTANAQLSRILSSDQLFTAEILSKALKNPAEASAVKRASDQGIFAPVFTNESRGQFTVDRMRKAGFKNADRAARIGNKLTSLAGRFMQYAEEYNRLSAFLGAYRLATSNPEVIAKANKFDKTDYKNAYDYAVGKVIDTQYLTTKEDRAYFQRFHPLAEVGTQFMSFPMKTLEQYVRHADMVIRGIAKGDLAMAKAGFVTLMAMAAPLVALAGVWALPGADWTREALERLAEVLWGSTQNFDADLREMLGGGNFATALVRGVPYEQGWFALNKRLAIDPVPFGDMGSAMSLFGPVGGLAEIPANMAQYHANGDYWNMAATLMPRAVGNVLRGMQIAVDQEQYTRRGNRVVTPADVERVDAQHTVPASVRQMLGFPPPEFLAQREVVSRAEEVNRQVQSATERVNKQLAGYLVDMMDARRRNDEAGIQRAVRNFGERVREVVIEQDGRPIDRRIQLNMQSIQRRAMADFYGISSPEALIRNGRAAQRAEVLRQRQMILGQGTGLNN